MNGLQKRILELVRQHGGYRAAARVLCVDAAYLFRLGNGEKVSPGSILLRRMGLKKTVVVTYERTK